MAKKKSLLRDATNPDEKALLLEIEEFRTRMFSAWLIGLQWKADFSDIAEHARLHPKTVENFVHGVTKNPSSNTVVRLAAAVGFRLTLVKRNTKRHNNEIASLKDAEKKVREMFKKK